MAIRTAWPVLAALWLASCGSSPPPRDPGPKPSWNPGDEFRAAMTNGAAALTADRHADGVKWFTLAASIEPRNVDARIGRARALLALRKADLARAEFEGVAGIDPGSAAAFAGLGEIYLRGEDGAKAVEALDKAIALKSDSAAFYRLRSQAHGAVGNMDGAREDARKASELGG